MPFRLEAQQGACVKREKREISGGGKESMEWDAMEVNEGTTKTIEQKSGNPDYVTPPGPSELVWHAHATCLLKTYFLLKSFGTTSCAVTKQAEMAVPSQSSKSRVETTRWWREERKEL